MMHEKDGKVPEIFLKPYDPSAHETTIYKKWEESGYFNPDNLPGERSEIYSIVLPPPNVTGTLHVGHAYEDTLQDIAIRFQRMRGKKTLWVPGTDSAAIATQARVEKNIQKEEGKNRHDLGREELVKRVYAFAKNSENTILGQVRRMGTSLDWSRYAYTLDDKRNLAVFTAFKRMYDAGLIYRGDRIVNWDPKGQTTISDDEIVYEERDATLYTFKYWKDFPISISTTRPETKVGDTAVAVHPDDERYAQFVGKTFRGEFAGTQLTIKVVADINVEKDFGTGALGVTPAHSMIDWDIAERHGLPKIGVINEYAKMSDAAGTLVAGLKVGEAREKVAEWLRAEGLMEKEEVIKQNVSTAERTGGIVEPLPKLQWWVNVNQEFVLEHSEIDGIPSGSTTTLKKMMRQVVEGGQTVILPERYEKIYFNWIDNLRDWCISRQIWFGHRIPVWYKNDEVYCGVEAPKGDGWIQDDDVLDTWFSSGLWTFSTLGWPEKTSDLKRFHPNAFMCPGYEILPLWVSRMILMSGFLVGQVPFKRVMIHGMVRAKDGRKFSKSLNNGVDPLDIINKYGADALRMGLVVGAQIGNDVKFDESKVKGYKLFSNKIWNITRFVLENRHEGASSVTSELTQEYLNRFREVAADVTTDMEEYRFYLAGEKLYHFIWHTFADEMLESAKKIFAGDDQDAKVAMSNTLYEILGTCLKLLHPFMPFVTEAIWQQLPEKDAEMLMIAKWPSK